MKTLSIGATLLALVGAGAIFRRPPPAPTPPPAKMLAGLTTAEQSDWSAGRTLFKKEWTEAEGLGPFFTGFSCAFCHGAEGNRSPWACYTIHASLTQFGAPKLQAYTIFDRDPVTTAVKESRESPAVIIPQLQPLGHTAEVRHSQNVLGSGLVESIPDAEILANASNGGRATKVKNRAGQFVVGRLGKKCQQADAFSFTAEAMHQEMGLTNPVHPDEIAELNDPATLSLIITKGINTDLATVEKLSAFVRFSQTPSQGISVNSNFSVAQGWLIFQQIGCASCHRRSYVTESEHQALDGVTIYPYSDYLLHDMGPLWGDHIAQVNDWNDQEIPKDWMRTAPLWGLRFNESLWFDGSIKGIATNANAYDDAIKRHTNSAQSSQNKWNSLTSTQKSYVRAFLNSL